MSYMNMDHADWVQRQIPYAKKSAKKPRRDKSGRTLGWYAAPDMLTPFQRRAFDVLGIVGGGIYNAPVIWESVDWVGPEMIGLLWGVEHGLGTWDFDGLTRFVFLCHTARIRGY